MRWLWRSLGALVAVSVILTVALLALIARPGIFFAHAVTHERLSFLSTTAQPEAATRAFLEDVSERLNASVLGPPEQEYTLYSTDMTWRTKLFFTYVQKAGGVVYVPIGPRHAFLTGSDIPNDRLLKAGATIVPPRTLSYYAVHELTHLRMAEMVPVLDYHRLPRWVREGIPDYVALGPVSTSEKDAILDWGGTHLSRMIAHGSYPMERVLVDFALNSLAIPVEALISNPMDRSEILAMLRTARQKGQL